METRPLNANTHNHPSSRIHRFLAPTDPCARSTSPPGKGFGTPWLGTPARECVISVFGITMPKNDRNPAPRTGSVTDRVQPPSRTLTFHARSGSVKSFLATVPAEARRAGHQVGEPNPHDQAGPPVTVSYGH